MTPALQLYSDHAKNDQPGDCFRTCVAMLLDLPPAEVPHFVEIAYNAIGIFEWDKMRAYEGDDVDGDKAAQAWLQERGYDLVEWSPSPTPTAEEPNRVTWFFANAPARYAIASGTSPNGDWWHCVILDTEKIRPGASLRDFTVADPNPNGKGILSLSLVQFVVPMNTAG